MLFITISLYCIVVIYRSELKLLSVVTLCCEGLLILRLEKVSLKYLSADGAFEVSRRSHGTCENFGTLGAAAEIRWLTGSRKVM